MTALISREKEWNKLKEIAQREQASFLALYGRRRVGKTYLVEEFFSKMDLVFISVTGLKDGTMQNQLDIFSRAIEKQFAKGLQLAPFKNWLSALDKLSELIEKIIPTQQVALFFDELPWLATQKSSLLQAIDHFWNTRWRKYKRFIFIVCGSAASWMLDNLIHAKGGLHNRLTDQMQLKPFNLNETKQFLESQGIKKELPAILELYMAVGGVPFYLQKINPKLSVIQNINQLCFNPNGFLYKEFNDIFDSLFNHSEEHVELIRLIAGAKDGIGREELANKSKLSSNGGYLTKRLKELEEANFIQSFIPFGKKNRDTYFRIIDEYSLFYLTWIEPVKNQLKLLGENTHYWENKSQSQQYKIWSGMAFEALCFKHISQICKTLQIQNLVMGASSWRYKGHNKNEKGTQIDLLLERNDGAINLCEIKYHTDPFVIDKSYSEKLQYKMDCFQKHIGKKKELFLTFISVYGVKLNMYSRELVTAEVLLEDLFETAQA